MTLRCAAAHVASDRRVRSTRQLRRRPRAERCATPHRRAGLLAAERPAHQPPTGDVDRELVDEEPRHWNLAALVVLGIARRDVAIHDDEGLDDRRAAPHQVEPTDAQTGQLTPAQTGVGEEQHKKPGCGPVRRRRRGVLAALRCCSSKVIPNGRLWFSRRKCMTPWMRLGPYRTRSAVRSPKATAGSESEAARCWRVIRTTSWAGVTDCGGPSVGVGLWHEGQTQHHCDDRREARTRNRGRGHPQIEALVDLPASLISSTPPYATNAHGRCPVRLCQRAPRTFQLLLARPVRAWGGYLIR